MFELMDSFSQTAVIKVIGVGGGGGNAVSHMAKSGIEGVEFICVNTDAQALKHSQVKTSLQIGCNITKGLGAGANPEVGRQAKDVFPLEIDVVVFTVPCAAFAAIGLAGEADALRIPRESPGRPVAQRVRLVHARSISRLLPA